ncbi:hypothetical protein QUF80_15995 [Desulfococcaceae bacterium HSG8]|nr:hypothetical protein [Desulfococcaceae bacterium HSG8]
MIPASSCLPCLSWLKIGFTVCSLSEIALLGISPKLIYPTRYLALVLLLLLLPDKEQEQDKEQDERLLPPPLSEKHVDHFRKQSLFPESVFGAIY